MPSVSSRATSIFVLDNTRIATQLLHNVLSRDAHFNVLAPVTDSNASVAAAAEANVALISANLEGDPLKGCEFVRRLRSLSPQAKVIVLVDQPEPKVVLEAFRAGARGVFCRSDSLKALTRCISSVDKGQIWAGTAELHLLLEAIARPAPMLLVDAKGETLLSNREQDVVRLVAEGLTNREIAGRLKLSEHTVKNHLFNIFDKLGISNRAELILYTVGQLYGFGERVPLFQDDLATFKWCREAVERCTVVPYVMAEMCRQGRGVPADPVSALSWFIVAEDVSSDVCGKSRAAQEELQSGMTVQQLRDARRRAASWLRKATDQSNGKNALKATG